MVLSRTELKPKLRRVSILGSTGSIGCNTLDLIERNPDKYSVDVLTANSNFELLAKQAISTNAKFVAIGDERFYNPLKKALRGIKVEIGAGKNGILEAASRPVDWVMSGIVGAAGLRPTIVAISHGGVVALANKECLVCAGKFMLEEVVNSGAILLPVDSEHNAIFQVFAQEQKNLIEKIILTASGGPFIDTNFKKLANVTPQEAVAHPNWEMGPKISVDSATMMNKGLELIEAHYLFEMPEDKIEILVHRQSIVHSLVSYVDGSVLSQLGFPDMRIPIAYALAWPMRIKTPSSKLDLAKIATLTFEEPNETKFPAIGLAREALKNGGVLPIVLNASNEIAVAAFLEKKIGFLDITKVVERVLEKFSGNRISLLEDVYLFDEEARSFASNLIKMNSFS